MELLALVTAALLTSSVVLSGPDTIGKYFLYSLPEGEDGNLAVTSADGNPLQCTVTSGKNSSQMTTGISDNVQVSGAINVSCSNDVTAIVSAGRAVSALLPVDVLGTQYTAITENIVVLATKPDTRVTITEHEGKSNNSYTLQSNVTTGPANVNLTGAKIESNKPVSVLNGLASLPPINTWSNKYLLTELNGDRIFRILGNAVCNVNEEKITFNDMMSKHAGPGLLSCDGPVLVGYFVGEDIVATMPPLGQLTNHAIIATPDTNSSFHLYIQIKSDALDELLINDQSAAEFQDKQDSSDIADGYVELEYIIPKGEYTISHKRPNEGFFALLMDESNTVLSFSPLRMANTGDFCKQSETIENDGMDNDCDYSVDEELLNGIDDDDDGEVDEDIATNESYGDTRDNSGRWPLSYTVLIIVLCIVLLVILIALCHWQCDMCNSPFKDMENDLMITSYDSRSSSTVPPRYSLSGSRSGFTISRR